MKKKYVKFTLLLLLIIGVVATYAIFDPSTNKYFPTCPFYKFTGFFCPGCGSQRALHYLLVGNLTAAINSNVLLVISLPFLIIYYGIETINYFKNTNVIKLGIVNNVWFIYSVAAIIILYWIIRNISFSSGRFLAPL